MPQLVLRGKKKKRRKFDYQTEKALSWLLPVDWLLGNPDVWVVSSLACPSPQFCGLFSTMVFAFPEPVLYLATEGKMIFFWELTTQNVSLFLLLICVWNQETAGMVWIVKIGDAYRGVMCRSCHCLERDDAGGCCCIDSRAVRTPTYHWRSLLRRFSLVWIGQWFHTSE